MLTLTDAAITQNNYHSTRADLTDKQSALLFALLEEPFPETHPRCLLELIRAYIRRVEVEGATQQFPILPRDFNKQDLLHWATSIGWLMKPDYKERLAILDDAAASEHKADVGAQSKQRETEGLSEIERRDSYVTVPQFLEKYKIPKYKKEACERQIRRIIDKNAGDDKIVQIIETSDITSTSNNKGVRTKQNRCRKNKNAAPYRIQEQFLLDYRMKNGNGLLGQYEGTVPKQQ